MIRKRNIYILIFTILVIGLLAVFVSSLYKTIGKLTDQLENQKQALTIQDEQLKRALDIKLSFSKEDILEKVELEIGRSKTKSISDETIIRIVTLSQMLKPYRYLMRDTLASKVSSPERGQLLIDLALIDMDTNSWHQILKKADFSEADLENMELREMDFKYANLRGASFMNADFSSANFSNSDLRESNFWGADLNKAIFTKANLKRADFQWAALNGANFESAIANGANFSSSKMRNSNWSNAKLQYAEMSNAFLKNSEFVATDLYGSKLFQSNLTAVNLTRTNLMRTDFSETILDSIKLDSAIVEEDNWFEQLDKKKVIHSVDFQVNYALEPDKSKRYEYGKFMLKLKN